VVNVELECRGGVRKCYFEHAFMQGSHADYWFRIQLFELRISL